MTASAAVTALAEATTLTGARLRAPISLSSRKSGRRIASRWAPRATKVTSLPLAARRAPKEPPPPPAPITTSRIEVSRHRACPPSWRDHHPAQYPALAQVVEGAAGFRQRAQLDRDRRHLAGLDQRDHLVRLRERADIAAHDGQGPQWKHRHRQREAAADQPDDDDGAALGHRTVREIERLVGAGEIDRGADTAAGCLDDRLARAGIGRIEGFRRPGRQRRGALATVDIGNKNWLIGEGAGELQAHHADTAEPDDQQRTGAQKTQRLLDGAVAGEARAHQGTGELRRDALDLEQIARVRHHHVGRIATIDGDAEGTRVIAHVLIAAGAKCAFTAA